MPRAVRYDEFGGIDVLRVDEVERPVPGEGQVLVRVKAAGINPSEAVIRTGAVAELFPSTFPSGQGSDLAGVIEEVGTGVGGFSPGDEVIGFSNNRASQAELVLVEAGDLARKPENVSWEVAGGLYVAGVIPVAYGEGVADRIRAAAPGGVDAFIDTYGGGYVDLAIALGVAAGRIDTIADYAAAAKYGVKTAGGADAGPGGKVLAELAGLVAEGDLEVPTANVYPLARVREAYAELERRHTRGKIVLTPPSSLCRVFPSLDSWISQRCCAVIGAR